MLTEALAGHGIPVTVCVASGYGQALLPESPCIRILTGRMDRDEIAALMRSGNFDCVADCTHPHATAVTANIRAAACETGLICYRLVRDDAPIDGCSVAGSETEAVRLLKDIPGNILVTTGSKNLDAYRAVPDFKARLFARVLPSMEALSLCARIGLPLSHIIAMQGPFTKQLNEALIGQFGIRVLVTKESGREGGFKEKVAAAMARDTHIIVIRRPPETDGYAYGDLYGILLGRLA